MSLSLVLLASLSIDAQAGPLLQPLIEIVPVSEVVGDGTTQTHLYVVGIFKDGQPIDGMVLKPSTRVGRVGALEAVGAGIYHFSYVPPKVAEPTEAIITVKGKTPDKRIVNINETITLVPGDPFTMNASTNLAEMVLGRDDFTTVTFDDSTLVGDIAIRGSAGDLTGLTDMGGGTHKVRFEASKDKNPHLGIITAVAESGISTTLGYQVIPQLAPTTHKIEGEAGSSVVMALGNREYGPFELGEKGIAEFPMEITPGVTNAKVTTVVDRASTDSDVTIDQAESRHVLLFPLPVSMPADPDLQIKMRVLVLDATGKPDGNAKPKLTASVGALNKPVHIRDGIYEVVYTPAAEPGPLTITASLGNDVQTDTMDSELLAKRGGDLIAATTHNPVRHIVVVPEADQIRSDGVSELPLRIVTIDAYGHPVPNVEVKLRVHTGGGNIPETLTTDENGIGGVNYLAGREEFLVRIVAETDGATGVGSFPQSPGPLTWEGNPIGGQEVLQGIEKSWASLVEAELAAAAAPEEGEEGE